MSEAQSYMQQKAWDEISIMGEYNECIPATTEEKRKVINTLKKFKIDLADIENGKIRSGYYWGRSMTNAKKENIV